MHNAVRLIEQLASRDETGVTFDAVFRCALDGIMVVDDVGRLIDVNPSACSVLARSRDELLVMTLHELTEDPARSRDRFATLLREGRAAGEWMFHTPAGDIRTVQVAARANVLPGRHVAICRDVTEQRMIQRTLEEAQAIAHVGSFSRDLRTGASYWSAEVLRIFGCEDGTPSLELWLAHVHPDDLDRILVALQDSLNAIGMYEETYRIVRRNGAVRWVRDRGRVERDASGSPIRIHGVVQDITEQHLAQDELRRSKERWGKVFKLSPVGLVIVRVRDDIIVDMNDVALELIGQRRDDIVGRASRTSGMWGDRGELDRVYAAATKGTTVRDVATSIVRADGGIRSVQISAEQLDLDGEACRLLAMVDVTEQLSTQRALAQAEAVAHVGSWIVEIVPPRVVWSAEVLRIFGRETAPTSSAEYLSLVHPDDVEVLRYTAQRAFDTGESYSCEYRIIQPSGAIRWVCDRGVIDHDASGRAVRVFGTIRDITDHRQAAERLARSEQRYRRIVETSAQGVLTLTNDGVVEFANARAAELLQTTIGELVGKNIEQFIDVAERPRLAGLHARRLAGLIDTYDMAIVTATGHRVLAELTASPLYDADGRVDGSLAVISEVTPRRQAEELRARLAAIVESSRDAISSCSLDGKIQTWNSAARRLFGYTAAEIVGQSRELLLPEDRIDLHRNAIAEVLEGEAVTMETQRRHKDGSLIEVSVTLSPVMDATGKIVAISTVTRDIRTQKRLEASLREAEERLLHLQKMEAVGSLAGGIAHDFNNILSIILSCAQLIEESLPRRDPLLEDARSIREAADRAAMLTRQLLAFSRKQVLEPRVINIGQVVVGIEKILRRLLGEHIQLDIVGRGGNVLIDPSQFEQVILNLAVNARDAMPDGGTLRIESGNVQVTDQDAAGSGASPGEYVQITVTDTGVGMDVETRKRMFEPFFTTKEKGRGTGLGLSTVFGIVRQSGGFMRVDSKPGRGTAISTFIPRTDRSEPEAGTGPLPTALQRGGETILLVEDEEPLRKLVAKALRRFGYEVLVAANAGEALLFGEKAPKIDLLLTDVVMPLMNGRELSERLRSQRPGLPTLFMSGYHDDEHLRASLDAPDVAFLQKPVSREALLGRIRELLERVGAQGLKR